MNKDQDLDSQIPDADEQDRLFAERKRRLEAIFRMADERPRSGPAGPFNREEIYAERIESICRRSSP